MTITNTEKEWLLCKEEELRRAIDQFGGMVVWWDNYRYQQIIRKLQRENRRLKTQSGVKA